MENPEEILHSLEEFSKMKPKDIPRELEEYLKFVAKTGDPVYQWSAIKSLFREKLINVISEFYESCAAMDIPPCPNVEMFNYDLMKNFILEKLETFGSAPFTLQRICELLTSPKKEYTRIDKFMRALEKNILVVSTMEPGGRRTENGEIMNGVESDHEQIPEPANEINVEEMDEAPFQNHFSQRISFDKNGHDGFVDKPTQEIVCVQYVSIEPVNEDTPTQVKEDEVSVTITAVSVPTKEQDTPAPSDPEPEPEKPIDIEPTVEEETIEAEPVQSSEPEIPTSTTTAISTPSIISEPSEPSITSSDSQCAVASPEPKHDDSGDKQEDADSTETETSSEAVAVAEPVKEETNEVEVPEAKEAEVSSSPVEVKEKEMEVDVVVQEETSEPESSDPPESV